jgi:hypothetical protein
MRNDRPHTPTRCGDDTHDVPMLSTIDCNARRERSSTYAVIERSGRSDDRFLSDECAPGRNWNNPPFPCILSRLIVLIPSCRRIASSPTYRMCLRRPLCVAPTEEILNRIDQELFVATAWNNLAEIRRLLSVGADVNAQDNNGWTPLHEATWFCHLEVVIELLGHGADTENKDDTGETPLHHASCSEDHLAIVKALMSGGANILAADNDGGFPIHNAVSYRNSEVTKYLLSTFIYNNPSSPSARALGRSHVDWQSKQ